MNDTPIRVTVWNEFFHERENAEVAALYPEGIHGTIAAALGRHADLRVTTATMPEPEHGLGQAVLDATDVLLWWGHVRHERVDDKVVDDVVRRVWNGMGFIALHSALGAKPFHRLMGTSCSHKWREAAEVETLWVVAPGHPIVEGIDDHFCLPQTEMYGEWFDIPTPDDLVLISSFSKGSEVFRSGCCWTRGAGRVFYFRPGHETYPIYHDENVQRILANAVRWAAPRNPGKVVSGHYPLPQ